MFVLARQEVTTFKVTNCDLKGWAIRIGNRTEDDGTDRVRRTRVGQFILIPAVETTDGHR